MASPFCRSFLFFFLLLLTPIRGTVLLIYEEGYSISTVLEGDKYKVKVNPHSILPLSSTSSDLFVLLDSAASTFYTISLPAAPGESVIQKLAGNGQRGYKDGGLDSAMFSNPRNFALDYKGNVYVADRTNRAIRKITKSGVTTIAGGSSKIVGRTDGSVNNASFSDDFELTFAPERCALMVVDHGHRLVHQLSLKAEDCSRHSGSVLGTTSLWLLGLALSSLVGVIVGFVIRPYATRSQDCKLFHWSRTWKHCLMILDRQTAMLCYDIRNAIVNSAFYSLSRRLIILSFSHLSLMLSFQTMQSHSRYQASASLLDSDVVNSSSSSFSLPEPAKIDDQLKDLLSLDLNWNLPVVETEEEECAGSFSDKLGKIDDMIRANVLKFEEQNSSEAWSTEHGELGMEGLIKRR